MQCIDMKLICRLCAKEDKFCIDVFSENGVKNNIAKKVRLCLPIAIKEDDKWPRQICLSCLNKLDTSYELYSGSMNAQNTIKKLLKNVTHFKPPGDDLCVAAAIVQVQNDTNFMAEQQPTLSQSKPFKKFGKTVVRLQDPSSKTRNDKQTPEPGLKVRQLQSERPHNQNLELNNDPNTSGSSLQSTKLQDTSSKKRRNEYIPEPGIKVRRLQSERHDNPNLELDSDDDDDDGGGGGADDDDDDDGGGGGSTQAKQQVSQLGLPTENLSAYTVAPSDLMYVDGNIGTVSSSQQQFGTSGIVSEASSVGQLVGSVVTQPQVYIQDSVYSSSTDEQGGSTAGSLSLVTKQEVAPQHQSNQQGQAEQHQQYTSLENQEPTIPACAGIIRAMSKEKLWKSGFRHSTSINGSSDVLVTTPSCVVLPQQHKLVSVNTVPSVMQTNSQDIYISNPIQNNTSIGANEQAEDFKGQHLYSSGHGVQAQDVSSCDAVTATTNAVIATISNGRAVAGVTVAASPTASGAISLGVPTTSSMVTPTVTSSVGIGVHAQSTADTTPILNMGVPDVTKIGIIAPFSNSALSMLTATAPASTPTTTSMLSAVTSIASSTNSTAVPDSYSAIGTENPSTLLTTEEHSSDSLIIIEESSNTTDVKTDNTVSSITTPSTSTATCSVATTRTRYSTEKNLCQYCNQTFPENIIVHHRKLHFRQRFFSCITCGKNFRTEVGLENHRCEKTAE